MKAPRGYSVWLVPDCGTLARYFLDNAIRHISVAYGTPVFVPHVTLVGGLEKEEAFVVDRCARMAQRIAHIPVFCEGLGPHGSHAGIYEAEQKVFVRVAHSLELMGAQRQLAWVLGVETLFVPRITLAQGVFAEVAAQHLIRRAHEHNLESLSFTAHHVHIYRAPGATSKWQCVSSLALTG